MFVGAHAVALNIQRRLEQYPIIIIIIIIVYYSDAMLNPAFHSCMVNSPDTQETFRKHFVYSLSTKHLDVASGFDTVLWLTWEWHQSAIILLLENIAKVIFT